MTNIVACQYPYRSFRSTDYISAVDRSMLGVDTLAVAVAVVVTVGMVDLAARAEATAAQEAVRAVGAASVVGLVAAVAEAVGWECSAVAVAAVGRTD